MSKFGLKPFADRVVVEKVDVEQKTKGGIIIAEQDSTVEVFHGKVVAVGDGKRLEGAKEVEAKVGDIVAFNPRIPTPIKYEGKDYLLLRDSDILCSVD